MSGQARGESTGTGENETPLVSIVVPSYNAERYLRLSLDSIVGQTYGAREIILMDDASRDGTEAIARSYGDRIVYHRQPRNRGQFGNVQDGIALARGEYIAIYHSDDVYFPDIVASEVEFLQAHPEAGAVFAMEIFIDGEGRENGRLALPPEIRGGVPLDYATILNTLLLYKNRIFAAPSSMVRTSVYRTIGPYRGDEYPVAGDFEMFFRIARQYPVGILDRHLFKYRWGHGNADQMDRLLRTTREPFFAIMQEHLDAGGHALAGEESMAAHYAHIGEDVVMRAMNCYIMKRASRMLPILAETSPKQLMASPKVQGIRLTALYVLFSLLARLPHISPAATIFRKRWYSRVPDAVFERAMGRSGE